MYLFFKIISYFPFPVLYFFSDVLCFVIYYILPYRKKIIIQNLKNSFPEKSEKEIKVITYQFYKNLTDIIFETIKAFSISPEELLKRIQVSGDEKVFEYLSKNTSVIALVPHLSNHEWHALFCSLHFKPFVNTIYKPLSNKFYEKIVYKIRTRFGNHLIPMKIILKEMLKKVNSPQIYAFASDQTPPKEEIQYRTKFLNQDTAFYIGAQKLSNRFHYPMVFSYMVRIKRGYYKMSIFYFNEHNENQENYSVINQYAFHLEEIIKQYPEQWLWSHRRWKY